MHRSLDSIPTSKSFITDDDVRLVMQPSGLPIALKRKKKTNFFQLLQHRQIGKQSTINTTDEKFERWAETLTTQVHKYSYFDMPSTTKSAISICFSPDGAHFASTHGDHTVKIVNYSTGKIFKTLIGHPRTPWTVKYHPTNPRFVASGCLGFEVRIWDVILGQCLYIHTLQHAIISLSFHPSGDILAIASGNTLYLWEYKNRSPQVAMTSRCVLRCVRFLPDPTKLIIGEANERQASSSELTVSLTLLDFNPLLFTQALISETASCVVSRKRRILNCALLYNDGGFDISSCGRYLAVCADFSWVCNTSARDKIQGHLDVPGSPEIRRMSGQVENLSIPNHETQSTSSSNNQAGNYAEQPARRVRARLEAISPAFEQIKIKHRSWLILVSLENYNLGKTLQMAPLLDTTLGGVTSVKLSPKSAFALLGYGVRDRVDSSSNSLLHVHRVATIHRWEDMEMVYHLESSDDDVNISLFHPFPGNGFLYGTKQGRIRSCVPQSNEDVKLDLEKL